MSKDSYIKRIGENLHKVTPVLDEEGNLLHQVVKPLLVEFKWRDFMQVIVGSAFLAIPIAYSQESWDMGTDLPLSNVVLLCVTSVLILAGFIYWNSYRGHIQEFRGEFFKRVIFTYVVSVLTVALLMTLVGKTQWETDMFISIKRIIIVSFPASMGATLTDLIK